MKNWNRWNSHRWSTTLILAIKNLWADKTANMHAYRVYIKYKISQNLRRLGLLNKARRIQRIHNIFQPLSLCTQIILTQHPEYPRGSHLSQRSIQKVKTTKKLCSVFLRKEQLASVFTLPKVMSTKEYWTCGSDTFNSWVTALFDENYLATAQAPVVQKLDNAIHNQLRYHHHWGKK